MLAQLAPVIRVAGMHPARILGRPVGSRHRLPRSAQDVPRRRRGGPRTRTAASLCLLLWASSLMAADNADPTESSGTPGTAPDPVAGGDQALSAGQVQSLLQNYAQDVANLQSQVEDPAGSPDTLYHNLTTYNAGAIAQTQQAQTALGIASPSGPSIQTGYGSLSLAATVSGIDYPGAYPATPSSVSFITSEKNQLAGLNDKLQRASGWLNKHTCGGFDWASQFDFLFKAQVLKEYLTNLGEGVIAAAPMALLGAFSPQLAEIVKHLKLIAGFDLSAAKMDCQTIQNTLTTGIQKQMWAEAYGNCMSQQSGSGIDNVVMQCQDPNNLAVTTPDGTQTNPITSAVNGNQASWVQPTYSYTQAFLDEVSPGSVAGSGAQQAQGAASAAGDGSVGGPEGAALQGEADAAAGGSGASVVGELGNDLSGATRELAETLFGSVRIQGTGALELGRKTYSLFDLKVQAHAARLRDHLAAQLLDHYALITAPSFDYTQLQASYGFLKLWTWQSRGADADIQPWMNGRIVEDTHLSAPQEALQERIDDHTMDACAYLLQLSATYAGNEVVHAAINRDYDIEGWVTALSQLECYLYADHVLGDQYQSIQALAKDQPASQADTGALGRQVLEQMQPAMQELRRSVISKMEVVLAHLAMINAYRPVQFSNPPPGQGSPGPFPQPEIRFGNQNDQN